MFDDAPFRRIGLSDGEIKVYRALLGLGQCSAGPIVDASNVTRSKIYDILHRLMEKGLVSVASKGGVRLYAAAPPKMISNYLDAQQAALQADREAVEAILPQLTLEQHLARNAAVAEVFVGVKGMEAAFEVLVAAFDKDIIYYAFGAGLGENPVIIQRFFDKLQKKREAKRVVTKIIFDEESRGKFSSQEKSKRVSARYLHRSTPASISVYDDFVLIAILNKEPITVLIRSHETAVSFQQHFEGLWKLARV